MCPQQPLLSLLKIRTGYNEKQGNSKQNREILWKLNRWKKSKSAAVYTVVGGKNLNPQLENEFFF